MRRTLLILALVSLAVFVAFGRDAAGTPTRAESKHFVIHYDTEESFHYVHLVLDGFEAAYEFFVVGAGFETFTRAVEIHIPAFGMDGMGTEYLDADDSGEPMPVIEIAPEDDMASAVDQSMIGMSLEEAVRSTAAHEFFHVLQDFAAIHGKGDVTQAAFVEPFATAAQEAAVPEADDYLDAAVDLFFAPDGAPFLSRGYDGGLFWVFILDRYGGVQALRDVMAASASADGARAIDRAFAARGLTFLDLWAKFVAAWATGTLPDASAVARYVSAWRSELGLQTLSLPAPIASAIWNGVPATLGHVTEETPADEVLGHSDATPGSPLEIDFPYGIDVVSIQPFSEATLVVSVIAAEASDFRVAFVGRRGAAWDLLSLFGRKATVRAPDRYDEIRVWLTRGEMGTGAYIVRLSVGT